jgi:serine/threonine-protein kinase
MALAPNQQRLMEFLKTKRIGESVTEAELLQKTGWKRKTLDTYRSKHYVDPFLQAQAGRQYRVLRDGDTLSEREIQQAFTQVRPGLLVLTKGTKLKGADDAYELIAFIGNGAVADVWRARAEQSQESVAIKVMNPRGDLLDPAHLPNVTHRFSRESRNSMKLSHPHIVCYRDLGELDKHPFLVMDLADASVAKILESRALKLEESLTIVHSCLLGLQYLHSNGCIHRDVKPLNMLQFADRFVLGDLGIVQWPDLNPTFTSAGTITINSIRLGSWNYMAPEQRAAPHEAGPHSDVYALGISWYEMLTQKVPDPTAIGAGAFPAPTSNPEVDALIRKMLAYHPTDRPNVTDLVNKLSELLRMIPQQR